MPIYQAYNKKSKTWVKYEFDKNLGFKVVDVKEKDGWKPFKGVKIRGKRK